LFVSLAIVNNTTDVFSFIRQLDTDTYANCINTQSDYVHFLQNCIEIARHKLLKCQIENRWEWWLAHATSDDKENKYWESWFKGQSIDPVKFFQDMKDWMLCTHFKKNSFLMWGKANSGKTMTAKAMTHCFVTHYQAMCGAHSDFAMEGFINVAIAVIEEAFFMPKEAEDWKQLMSGGHLTVNKKYHPKQTICRTPCLFTSNHRKFGRNYLKSHDENAFTTRLYEYGCHMAWSTSEVCLTGPGLARYCQTCLPLSQAQKEAVMDRMEDLRQNWELVNLAGALASVVEQRRLLFQEVFDKI